MNDFHTALIPTRNQCFSIMEQEKMPLHIQKHSEVVTQVALYLAHHLSRNGVRLNIQLVEAAGLLHDIAKARSIETCENHARLGAEMLLAWGYSPLAPIVEEHIGLDPACLKGPITESLIVNYADKRVKHDEIVMLEDRFDDLVVRYGRTPQIRSGLEQKRIHYLHLEGKIFEHLSIRPGDLLNLPLDTPDNRESSRSI